MIKKGCGFSPLADRAVSKTGRSALKDESVRVLLKLLLLGKKLGGKRIVTAPPWDNR